jgi:hypothetical protein
MVRIEHGGSPVTSPHGSALTPHFSVATLLSFYTQVSRGFYDDLLGAGSDVFWRTRWIDNEFFYEVGDWRRPAEDREARALPLCRSFALWLERHAASLRFKYISLEGLEDVHIAHTDRELLEAALSPFLLPAEGEGKPRLPPPAPFHFPRIQIYEKSEALLRRVPKGQILCE